MQYRVLWAPFAEEKLGLFLKNSPDAGALAAATREIDRHLFAAAAEFGESRYDTMRVGFAYPFGVQFEVMEDVRTAIVHDIWRIDKK